MLLRMTLRPNVVLGLLAVAAFAVVLGVTNRDRMRTQGLAIDGQTSARAEAATAGQAYAASSSSQDAAAQQPTPRREPTAEESQTIARLSEAVRPQGETTSEDAEKRGDAIRQLATLPGPQAAQALVHAARNDDDPRNRILAVEALRRAGAGGDANWVIRDALREASSSTDEIIAAQARAAYDELVAKLGTER